MVLACIAGVLKAVSEKPVYQARLTMAVEPSSVRSGNQSVFDPYAYRFYETQYELLKSRSVAERVVEELKLAERESVQKMLITPSLWRSLAVEFKKMTGIQLYGEELARPSLSSQTDTEKKARAAWLTAIIQGGVNVSGGEKTNLVSGSFNSTYPEFAAEIANSLVQAYISQGLDSQLDRTQQRSQWLSQRIDELKKTLNLAQAELQKFLVEEEMLGSNRSNKVDDSELQVLNNEVIATRATLDDLAKRYGARHPRITEARAEYNAAKGRLDRKSRNISLSRVKNIQLERLEKDVRDNQELYDAFLARFKEADLSSSGSQLASARIIDRALPPGGPIYPQKQRIILMWTLGGLFLGIMLALLREQLDTTFKSGRVIEDKLNLPLFGVVQAMPSNLTGVERHYLENKRSVFSESINHIRTGVTYSNVDNPPRVILITSSVQSEGKTTVASNLALSYAQLGPTLLIDADLRRPRIKHIIETDHSNGLVDYVAGVVSLKECLSQDKEEDNLYILNSGTTPPNPLELLASEKFSAILTALRSKFTYIIIDTAPVLPASDAVVLGQLSDALLMVVQSDRTTHHMARDAIKRLNASRVEVDGLVLSQANIKKGNPYQYGGYYGYGAYAYVEDED
jgi:capsular exopolysaccharide synthesis family protein